ncbi:hypothetical protein LWF15_24000 [Kineosporia rhizophila]|uniref:expansin EXLX1 family cellulose-binding protein n=1 Tax=Kineosporia rhizophila TaxID=84633 RepID=UPI000AED6FAB|nr:expansin EXLX1 family cellulose-binding protein [Kineosporia rhizophila]MCE0538566.1 hypothetical protein [Kineosporia rhizophila]
MKIQAAVAAAALALVVGSGVYVAQSSSAANPTAASTTSTTSTTGTTSTTSKAGTLTQQAVSPTKKYKGVATHYDADGTGACSYPKSKNMMVAALNTSEYQNSQMCGAFLKVTGPKGNSIRVKIVDLCPGDCRLHQLDLSREAFAKLADPVTGQINVTWKLVTPKPAGPVSYVYKDGSTKWWCGVQVRNHRNPIKKLELKTASGWVNLARKEYNYFESPKGVGCGKKIRITDIFGHRLVDSGIKISTKVQKGAKQLPAA